MISLSDGRTIRATTLGMNRNVDAGLIKIEPNQNGGQPWPHATLGESDNLVPWHVVYRDWSSGRLRRQPWTGDANWQNFVCPTERPL